MKDRYHHSHRQQCHQNNLNPISTIRGERATNKAPNSGESVSGLGSDLNICKQLIFDLNFFITKNNIKSILDLACGDFMWMKNIVMENENIKSYLGLEIVEGIVKNNNTNSVN